MKNVDFTKTVTHASFCSGYDGIGMGLSRVIRNLRNVLFVEIETFACANLVAKMEKGQMAPAPIWTNLKTFDGEPFRGKVDIISAGYPCQPFSQAGNRAGTDDPRHLWPFVRRAVRTIKPRFVFLENVEGHISLGLNTVISDLADDGYVSTWGIFSAKECGAPHQRKRVFILAYDSCQCNRLNSTKWERRENVSGRSSKELADSGSVCTERADQDGINGKRICEFSRRNPLRSETAGCRQCGNKELAAGDYAGQRKQCKPISNEKERNSFEYGGSNLWPARPGERQYEWEPPRTVGNAEGWRAGIGGNEVEEREGFGIVGSSGKRELDNSCDLGCGACNEKIQSGRDSVIDAGQRQTQSQVGGNINGNPGGLDYARLCESCTNRTDELRLLGNGVVPAAAAKAFSVLYDRILKITKK